MYIIISNTLETNEIFARAKFATRLDARKNLLKVTQNWLCHYKAGQEWEVISDIKEATHKTKYYLEQSLKNEDIISVFEKIEAIEKGWVYNGKTFKLVKVLIFSIIEVAFDEESPVITKTEEPVDRKVIKAQNLLISDLKSTLVKRRIFID